MKRYQSIVHPRRGAALVLLVVVLLLVIVSATQSLVITTVANRQAERKHSQVRVMLSAIQQATAWDLELKNPVIFPVNEAFDERVEVTVNTDQTAITAIWYFRKIKQCEITRPYDSQSLSRVSEKQPTSEADE